MALKTRINRADLKTLPGEPSRTTTDSKTVRNSPQTSKTNYYGLSANYYGLWETASLYEARADTPSGV